MNDAEENYSKLGAIVGGAIFGFIVFGFLGMHLLSHAESALWPFLIAVGGAILGAWSQLKYGDHLWHVIKRSWLWWWW